LLQALDYLVRRHEWPAEARVIICGGGPLEARLHAYAREHSLSGIVTFTGYITEEHKPRFLAGADVAVYPSTGGESFGVVLLEAMAAARGMVLAGDNPGYASVMAPHPQSLFDPHDTKAFAQKLRSALKDEKARQQAHAWQNSCVKTYDVQKVGERTLAVYERALQNRAR
jgi:phosphatidylinositol alpha-mannosyltransferase